MRVTVNLGKAPMKRPSSFGDFAGGLMSLITSASSLPMGLSCRSGFGMIMAIRANFARLESEGFPTACQ